MDTIQSMTGSFQLQCFVLILSGFLIRYWVQRWRFNRRSSQGFEQFANYFQAVFIRFFEKLLILVSYLLILSGVIRFLLKA